MTEKVYTVATSSGLSATIASLAGIHDIAQIGLVGFVGGVITWLKKCDLDKLKNTPLEAFFGMFGAIAIPFAFTVWIFYIGTDGINKYYIDLGNPIWIFTGFLFAFYYDNILPALGSMAKTIFKTIINRNGGNKDV